GEEEAELLGGVAERVHRDHRLAARVEQIDDRAFPRGGVRGGDEERVALIRGGLAGDALRQRAARGGRERDGEEGSQHGHFSHSPPYYQREGRDPWPDAIEGT